jgi:ubiquinol-cytochrome c reductase core subunit 2
MFATRASAARRVSHAVRSFATVVDSAGFKVATVDKGQPTSAVTFLVNAGSRFESKPGVANVLKNFAFKSTAKRSALGTIRESELYGGVLSATLSREHLALTAEFLRGDEAFFVDLLSSFITSAKFTRHEFEEYVLPVVEAESQTAYTDPATRAIELAHTLAFRSGLGSSIFASSHSSISVEDVKSFAASSFRKGNMVVLGTGIDQTTLSDLVEKNLGASSSPASKPASSPPSSYFGGESRIEAHGGPQTIFIGFGTAAPVTSELAVLAAHLSPQSSVKWSQGLSPIATGIPPGTSVKTVLLPYSDAVLFGLLVQGQTAEGVKEAGKVVAKALKDSTSSGGIKAEELKKAVAKAKFTAASAVENGKDGLVSVLGAKVLAGSEASLDGTFSSLDKITATGFSKAISTLTKGKLTYVAVGDVQSLPYTDELGL